MKCYRIKIPGSFARKILVVTVLIISCSKTINAQKIIKPDSSTKPVLITKSNFADTGNAKPVATYTYKAPTNELMRWPNFPMTPEQFNRNADKVTEDRKVLPKVLKTILSKKKPNGTTPPKF